MTSSIPHFIHMHSELKADYCSTTKASCMKVHITSCLPQDDNSESSKKGLYSESLSRAFLVEHGKSVKSRKEHPTPQWKIAGKLPGKVGEP